MGSSFSTPNLVHRLENGTPADKEIAAEYLCSKVKRYSDHKDYIQAVGKYAVKHLVDLCKNGQDKAKQYAAATLSYLALEPENKALIMKEGALPVLIGLAKTGTIEQKGAAAVAFANLGKSDPGNQRKIIEAGAVPLLLNMVKESKDGHHQVRCWAASALGNMCSQSPENQEKLGAAGALDALLELLAAKMPAFAGKSQDGLLVKAHDVVTCRRRKSEPPKGPTMAESAARNLNMLLYSHKLNQERLLKANGLVALLQVVKDGTPKEKAEALRTVQNVWGPIGAEVANAKLVEAGGIDLLVGVLRSHHAEAKEAAIGLVARLVASKFDYKPQIVEAGGIGALCNLFESGSPQARIWTTRALASLADASDDYRAKIVDSGGSSILELAGASLMRIKAADQSEADAARAAAEEALKAAAEEAEEAKALTAAKEVASTEDPKGEEEEESTQDDSEARQRKVGSGQVD